MNLAAACPADDKGRQPVRLVRVPPGREWVLHIAATRAATVWTHYTDKRTMPCADGDGECRACAAGLTRRFESYLAAELLPRRERVVVAIPQMAWMKVAAMAGDALDGGLLGCRLTLSRPEGDIRSQVRVGEFVLYSAGERRPRGIDTPAVLRRCWDIR